ncbi:MAG: hypothetical protein ACRD3O_00290 [Terriglobia bacterium]
MRISVATILVALCLSAGSASAVVPPAPPSSQCNCVAALPSALETRGTEKSPLTIRVTQMPVKTADEIKQGNTEWHERVSTDSWTIRLTLMTAVILGFQLWVFGIQAHRLNQSIKEAQRATEATLTAARAAEHTVITMNLTARRDLRAYVAVSKSSVDHLDETGRPRANVTIKNFGKTPAYRFAVSADITFIPPGTELREPREPAHAAGHLAPGGEFEVVVEADWVLSKAWRSQIMNKTAAVSVYGLIRYIDTYGKPRFTRFCIMTDGEASVPVGRLVSCATGNDTDDDAEIAAAAQHATEG